MFRVPNKETRLPVVCPCHRLSGPLTGNHLRSKHRLIRHPETSYSKIVEDIRMWVGTHKTHRHMISVPRGHLGDMLPTHTVLSEAQLGVS